MQFSGAKDLTKVPPRSPHERVGGFAIVARTIDKCRASLAGTVGEYHYDCPVDKRLFNFVGITGNQFKEHVTSGVSDDEIASWLKTVGAKRSDTEISAWSDMVDGERPYDNPQAREWFEKECSRLGLNSQLTTLFDYLDSDDTASF